MKKMISRSLAAVLAAVAVAAFTTPFVHAQQKAAAAAAAPDSIDTKHLKSLIPANAPFAGFVNGDMLRTSQLIRQTVVMAANGDEAKTAEALKQLDEADGICIFYLKVLNPITQSYDLGGAWQSRKANQNAFDKIQQEVDEAVSKSENKEKPQIKTGEIDGKKYLSFSLKDDKDLISGYLIQATPYEIQFRIMTKAEKDLAPALLPSVGSSTAIADMLDLKSMLSLSVDLTQINKTFADAMPQDPKQPAPQPIIPENYKSVTVSFSEKNTSLLINAKIASNPDGIAQIKAQIEQTKLELQENPMFANIIKTLKVTDDESCVNISAQIPSALLVGLIQNALPQKEEPAAAAPAPAANSGKTPAPAPAAAK